MATKAIENAAGKAGTQVTAEATFGNVNEKKQNPIKTMISTMKCGELQIRFESVEWLNKEDPTLGYDPPVPNFVARANGYKDNKGYMQDIPLGGDPEELRIFADILLGVAKFVEDTGVDISKAGFHKNDIGVAYEKFAPNGGKK